jgi:hypothetical protein
MKEGWVCNGSPLIDGAAADITNTKRKKEVVGAALKGPFTRWDIP